MTFPITSLAAEHRELGLVVAVLLGFCFGFVLERAGFGRSTKLAAQFYFYEMTVFKVMFSAIVTAMLGLVLASGLGLTELKLITETAASDTFIWPMLFGGLLFGMGFIVSGMCPGTSIVAAASGSLDGLFAFGGVVIGSLAFSEFYPHIKDFYISGAKGQLFLYDLLRIPPHILALMITMMAIGAFIGAEKLEKIFTVKFKGGIEPETPSLRPRRLAFSILAGLTALALVTSILPGAAPRAEVQKTVAPVSQEQLARRVLEEPWTLRILDLRDQVACRKNRIPGSECTPIDTLGQLGLPFSSGSKDLVLIGKREIKDVPQPALAYPGQILLLQGGFQGWEEFALTAPVPPDPGASRTEIEDYKFRASLHSAMTGMKPPPPPPAGTEKYVPKPKKKKSRGCS